MPIIEDIRYHKASTLDEAKKLHTSHPASTYYAGGNAILLGLRNGKSAHKCLIDIKGISELHGIRVEKSSLFLHSLTTYEQAEQSELIKKVLPSLSTICYQIADIHIRKRATLAGALVDNDAACDIAAAMLAYGAIIHTDERSIAYEKLLATRKSHLLNPGEILTAIEIPLGAKGAYHKHTKQASHYPVVGVFVCKRKDSVRVGITGADTHAFLSLALEKALREEWSEASIDFCPLNHDHLVSDMHAKKDFKLHLIKYLAGQCVHDIH